MKIQAIRLANDYASQVEKLVANEDNHVFESVIKLAGIGMRQAEDIDESEETIADKQRRMFFTLTMKDDTCVRENANAKGEEDRFVFSRTCQVSFISLRAALRASDSDRANRASIALDRIMANPSVDSNEQLHDILHGLKFKGVQIALERGDEYTSVSGEATYTAEGDKVITEIVSIN